MILTYKYDLNLRWIIPFNLIEQSITTGSDLFIVILNWSILFVGP